MYKHFIKRMLDLLIALIGFPVFLLILIIIAPLIWIEDRGPIFYNAPRIGKHGQIFKMYKFRSMKVNAPDLRNEDGTTFNSEHDPRVTRIGKMLRKTSLDETPQIINVLLGNMSIVGPRPDLPGADVEIYRPGDKKKLEVAPGITGYSQVYYRNSSTLEQRFDGDVFYAENVSLLLDISILFKSFGIVITHKNVYRN